MIALLRVDNRLMHGQILEAWLPQLGATEVVVADDEAAASALAKAAMTMCLPPQLPVRVVPLSSVPWEELGAAQTVMLVLVRDVAALARARAGGLTPAIARRVNIGNVHFGPGRKALTPSVFLSAEELETLRALAQEGFEIELRAVPREAPAGIEEIERRYASAR